MRTSFAHLRRLLAALLITLLLCPSAASAASSYLTCAIVATDDLELRPLELNQRDVVSVLDLVYEGLFAMDDNYMPQPEPMSSSATAAACAWCCATTSSSTTAIR